MDACRFQAICEAASEERREEHSELRKRQRPLRSLFRPPRRPPPIAVRRSTNKFIFQSLLSFFLPPLPQETSHDGALSYVLTHHFPFTTHTQELLMEYFEFKQFKVYHDRCAMKVGTDGVLLGAWAELEGAQHVLDIGCGSGLIALMAAQRGAQQVTGVEIDAAAAQQAAENVARSPFASRLYIHCADICHFGEEEAYDHILSNPPYFQETTLSPDSRRATARHAATLTHALLIERATHLLAANGALQLVLPTPLTAQVHAHALLNGLSLVRVTDVVTKPGKQPRRSLLHFVKGKSRGPALHTLLTLMDTDGKRSTEYQQLTRDFYL